MKKTLTIVILMILIMGMFSGVTNAASASVSATSSTVNNESTVTVTVSFGQKVRAAQFSLNFDASKLEFVSNSAGTYSPSTKKCSYYSSTGTEDMGSISFKFKAKAIGVANVSASGLRISVGEQSGVSATMGNSSTNITIKEKSTTTTKKPTTTTKKPATTNKKEETVKPEPAPNELIKLNDANARTLIHDGTNVMIKCIQTAIEDGVVLEVENINSSNEKYEKLDKILEDIKGNKLYFDINLLKDNVKIQPNGYVTVCIPISEYIPISEDFKKENIKIYYLDEENEKYELVNGEIQELEKEQTETTNENDKKELYYTFTTNHFSTYALVVLEEEKQDTQVIAPVEQNQAVEQNDFIVKALDFFRDPIVLSVIIGILVIIVIIQRIKISTKKE